MPALPSGFNANDVPPPQDFAPIPAGEYLAKIVNSEEKPTKDGEGSYHNLTFEIIDGEQSGRKVFTKLHLHNKSAEAVRIAWESLGALCRAVAVPQPKNTEELHGLPLVIKVKLVTRKDNGEPDNEIRGFKPKSEYKAKVSSSAPAGAGAAPWER